MNLELVDKIAKAVLYEGYLLYPYRPSAIKNRQRWNFGVLYPPDYSREQQGADACMMQTECLVRGSMLTAVQVRVRFLRLVSRTLPAAAPTPRWEEAVEHEVLAPACNLDALTCAPFSLRFDLPAENSGEPAGAPDDTSGGGRIALEKRQIVGSLAISAQRIDDGVFKLTVRIENVTQFPGKNNGRPEALLHSMVSTHTVLGAMDGEFISLLEPAPQLLQAAASCRNLGVWPVLVGADGERDTLLSSPIILYDYPQIAPESAGDLFDGTEIDEILSLRIMTLTDDEKQEIRQSDERARQILERTETLPPEHWMKLHGALRSLRPLKEVAP